MPELREKGIDSKDILVGPEGYETFARVFYRTDHAPVIHLVISNLLSKFT